MPFGCLDNLAWIWVTERSIKGKNRGQLKKSQIGFRKDVVQSSFTKDFRSYVDGKSQWLDYLENYRHALAHRIPLYIPPFIITPDKERPFNELETQKEAAARQGDYERYDQLDVEQAKLGRFLPIMTHSIYQNDSAPMWFHSQILADWNTVVQIVDQFLQQPGW